MTKLTKNRCRSSFQGIFIIGKVGKVGHNPYTVADDEQPFAKTLVAISVFIRVGNHMEQDENRVDINQCGDIKLQSPPKHIEVFREAYGLEQGMVKSVKCKSA